MNSGSPEVSSEEPFFLLVTIKKYPKSVCVCVFVGGGGGEATIL